MRLLVIIALLLPGCSFLSSGPEGELYTVQSGDTLSEIGTRYGVSAEYLRELNSIGDPRDLQAGSAIVVPGKERETGEPKPEKIAKNIRLGSAIKHRGRLAWPLRTGRLSSPFGRRWLSFHEGIDLSAEEGTPIYAAHDGIVMYSGMGLRGFGNLIVLKGDSIVTVYAHNRVNDVEAGDVVKAGQQIGEVGETGKAEAPHLHFEVRIKDSEGRHAAVDPLVFLGSLR